MQGTAGNGRQMQRAAAGCSRLLLAVAACVCLALAQSAPPTLAGVLAELDRTAPGLKGLSAQVEVTDYTALVAMSNVSHGMLYFERAKSGPMYVLDLTSPPDTAKRFVYRDETAWIYFPAANQVEKYALGSRRAVIDQYLLLGIGATGKELNAAYTITFGGAAALDGTPTVKLTLHPKDPAAAAKFTDIVIWYDTATWIAAQQRLDQPGGDYHQLRYRQVEINPHISSSVFSTRFPGATVVVPKL